MMANDAFERTAEHHGALPAAVEASCPAAQLNP